MYSKAKTYWPEILQIIIISESDRFGIEKHTTTHFFDRLRPFCAQFVVGAPDKVCSRCIVHAHDSSKVYSKLKTYRPEILQISIISETDRFGIEKHITTHLFDRLRPFCAQFVVWAPDKVCSRCIVHGHDSSCTLSSKPINQKFFK